MPKVICPCVECKYNGTNHRCKADYLRLTFSNVITIHGGNVDAWNCDRYELSDRAKIFNEVAQKFVEEMKNKYINYNRKD